MSEAAQTTTASEAPKRKLIEFPSLASSSEAVTAAHAFVDPASDDYKAGHAAGVAECEGRITAAESQCDIISRQFQDALAEMDARYRDECLKFVSKLYLATAPGLARQSALSEIENTIASRVVEKKQKISVRLHPALEAAAPKSASGNQQVSIIADDTMQEAAVEIRWESGGLVYEPDALIADIKKLIDKDETKTEEGKDG